MEAAKVTAATAVHLVPKQFHRLHGEPDMSPIAWLRRHQWLVVVVLVGLGLAVRLRHFLAAPSYWYDEAYLLVNIFDKSFLELLGPLRCEQAAPPLYLWILRGVYHLFGGSECVMRAPALVASVLSVLLMVPLARRLVGGPGWLWAVGFVAVSQSARFNGNLVKPYATDLLATEIAFLVGLAVLQGSGRRSVAWLGAFAAALALPWLSYPSVFALAGLSLGLALLSLQNRSWRLAVLGFGFTLTWSASLAGAWLAAGQHQRSEFLTTYWQPFFIDLSSPAAACGWVIARLVRLGHYGTTGMGEILFAFAVLGVIVLWRRRQVALALPLGTLGAMLVVNAARFYPLEDRLFFFALPATWLLAACGVGSVLPRARGAMGWLLAILLFAQLGEGIIRYAYWLAVVPSKVEYREAFELVGHEELPGDLWAIAHPEVYEVYFGKDATQLYTPEKVNARPTPRVWLIEPITNNHMDDAVMARDLARRGFTLQQRGTFSTVRIYMCSPPHE